MMKKNLYLLLTVVLMAGLFAVPLKAQNGGDGFFSDYHSGERSGDAHGIQSGAFAQPMHNTEVPLSGGLLVLAISGVGYALLKKNGKEENK